MHSRRRDGFSFEHSDLIRNGQTRSDGMVDRPLRDAVHAAEEEDSMRCQQQCHNNEKKKNRGVPVAGRRPQPDQTNPYAEWRDGLWICLDAGLKFVTVATAIEPRPPCQLSVINNGRDLQEPRSLGTFWCPVCYLSPRFPVYSIHSSLLPFSLLPCSTPP